MLVVLQWDFGAGRCRELALVDELTQCENQLLELACGRLEEVRQGRSSRGLVRWHTGHPCWQELTVLRALAWP